MRAPRPLRNLPYADPGSPDTRSAVRFLLWLHARQARAQLSAASWGFLALVASGSLAVASGHAVQALVDRSGHALTASIAEMAVLGALSVLGETMLSRAAVTNWITATTRVQQLVSRKVVELGAALPRRLVSGDVVTVSTSDAEKLGWFVEASARCGAAVAACVVVTALVCAEEPALGLLVAAGVPLLAVSSLPLLPAAIRQTGEQRARTGRAIHLAADIVTGLRVLRGVGGEELYLDRYRHASQGVRRAAVAGARISAWIAGQHVLLRGVFVVTVSWCGVRMLVDHRMSVGDLVTCYGLVTFLMAPLAQFEEMATAWSVSQPAAQRVAGLLATRLETRAPSAAHHGELSGDLYDPATGLLAPAGQVTGVVCADREVAACLVERLGGLGTLEGVPSARLGGVPLDAVPPAAARRAVLVQDKDPVLLSGTVRDLLDVPRSGAVSAAEALAAAQCDDVLRTLAQVSRPVEGAHPAVGDPGIAHLTERGRSVSGGQRQRLALARSLVTDPEVLVLDEPTSAVDAHTEARIAKALKTIRKGRTTVVITFSPLLLERADRVVFVTSARVRATGTHRALLQSEPAYRALVLRAVGNEVPPFGQRNPE